MYSILCNELPVHTLYEWRKRGGDKVQYRKMTLTSSFTLGDGVTPGWTVKDPNTMEMSIPWEVVE